MVQTKKYGPLERGEQLGWGRERKGGSVPPPIGSKRKPTARRIVPWEKEGWGEKGQEPPSSEEFEEIQPRARGRVVPGGGGRPDGLTRPQRRMLRDYRARIGRKMWQLNEALFPLRLKHRELGGVWTAAETIWASEQLEKLAEEVRKVRDGWITRAREPKTGELRQKKSMGLKQFCQQKDLAAQYRFRLCGGKTQKEIEQHGFGALHGLTLALGHFDRLDVEGRDIEEMLAETLREELLEGPRVATEFWMIQYLEGMKALRAAWTQLFFTLQAEDVRRFTMSMGESEQYHESIRETGEPPAEMILEWETYAHEHGVVAHIYDSDGEWVFEAMPLWYAGEDPESLRQRAALKVTKKARMNWGFRATEPGTVNEFAAQLTPEEKKRVTEFVEHGRIAGMAYKSFRKGKKKGYSIQEVAALTGTGVKMGPIVEEKSGSKDWDPERMRAFAEKMEAYGPNPSSDRDAREDYMLHRAIWTMDLED